MYLVGVFMVLGCGSDDVVETTPTNNTGVTLNEPVNDFVWKAMNSWYNWQEGVSYLDDTKDDNLDNYYQFLNKFATPDKLFDALLFQKDQIDRFSWFIEDYVEQEQQFQGISTSFGLGLRALAINDKNVILLVRHVSKESPAADQGIERGDIIIGLNGVKLTRENYSTTIKTYYEDTVEFIIGENDGITENHRVSLSRRVVQDNPVDLIKVFDDINGKKVGYLVYNGFRSSYNEVLNNAFAQLKSEGIQELILDFRYNVGGSLLSCAYLASMIYGQGTTSDLFAKIEYNHKHPNYNDNIPFLEGIFQYDPEGNYLPGQDIPLNRLTNISKVYIITTSGTASASEMIINGLRPYMEVETIGETTYGKNVGSITLYDSPSSDYIDRNTVNPAHKMAMQPITFQIYNSLNQSDYTHGFTPSVEVDENNSWNNLLELGNENEVMLKVVLDKIRGVIPKGNDSKKYKEKINGIENMTKFDNEMYIESNYIKNIPRIH